MAERLEVSDNYVIDIKTRSSDVVFSLKLLLCFSIFIFSMFFSLSSYFLVKCFGVVLSGLMFAHAVELQHQTLHGLGYRNRRANEIAGIFLGLPMLVSYTAYRESHLLHHRYLGTPNNKEFFEYGDRREKYFTLSAFGVARRLFMLDHYLVLLSGICRSLANIPDATQSSKTFRKIRREYLLMLIFITTLTWISEISGHWVILLLWVLPLAIVANPVHSLIELPEHHKCAPSTTNPFLNTRSIRSNIFMTWFTNGNNFHVEHHLAPGLPIERLGDLHKMIAPKIYFFNKSYFEFYLNLLRDPTILPGNAD
jgi:fatty acid desaturase